MTIALIYLLIASEFACAAGWYMVQWRTHEKRRENDLVSSLIYSLFAVSYIAYGFEGLSFRFSRPIEYVADGFIAVILAAFIFRKVFLENKANKNLKR